MLPKKYRLRKNKDFKKIYRNGRSFVGRSVVLVCKKSDGINIGFSVSKKIGNAVQRNKFKRMLREICRRNLDTIPDGYSFVIIARVKIKGFKYSQVEREVVKLFKEVKI